MIFREGDPKNELYPYMRDYTSFLKKMERPLVGRETEMKQLQAAMCRPELCNVILLAEAGSGKACAHDSLVSVVDERGYITMGELVVGDKVFDENGDPTTVLGVFPQGKLHAYKVVFEDGTSVVCNDEHIWAARTRSQHYDDRPYTEHTLREMIDYGIIRTAHRTWRNDYNNKSWYIPRNKAVKRPERTFNIDSYVLGVCIGDGCLTKSYFGISSNDEDIIRRIAETIGAVDFKRAKGNYTWYFLKESHIDGKKDSLIQTSSLSNMLENNTVFGFKSIDRRIPPEYMLGSIDQRMELLRGLMDTDGTVTGSDGRINVSFSTNSKCLADDVRELAASLGFRTTLHVEDRCDDMHDNPEYEVYFKISDEDATSLFWLQRHKDKIAAIKRDNKKFHRIYDDMAISEVIDLGYDTEMVCIYVDAPSHLYQVGKEHIVTHNTALVQGTMANDPDKTYLEVDLPRMISNLKNENEMADKLKQLFSEVERFRKAEGKEIVLFIDEFHQIVQLSPAAVEVLKPLLADSGTRGIIVIAATTYIEYQQYISANLPLVERLQRINLAQPNKEVVVSILRGMANRYNVGSQFKNDDMFEAIYEYTNRYIPANAQPRKSILMLDSMIGWHRCTKRPIDMKLLADVIYETEGINIAFRVDATKIKEELDKRVLSQDFATSAIENRLQICCADLNNKGKPMSSFLFTGSTGVGKTEVSKQLANILFEDERALIRMDMTEYALPESLERFREELTTNVWTRPYCIVLLDEIEKSCGAVTRLLLQVLDDGRLLDRNNREVTFKNAYIIVTTNAGSEIYKTIAQYNADDTGSGKLVDKYEKLIKESIGGTTGGGKFPPELLGRIDCLVPFQPLSEQTMINICKMKLNKLRDEVRMKHHVELMYDKRVSDYIVKNKMTTDSDAGGARAVVSRIEKDVTVAVSRFINAHPNMPDGKTVYVLVQGQLASEDKTRLETDAKIIVTDTPPKKK